MSGNGSGRELRSIVWWLAGTATVLGVFDFASATSDVARRGWLTRGGDRFARPPIYGQFDPSFARAGAWALGLAALAAMLTYIFVRRRRIPAAAVVAGAAILMFGFSIAVAYVSGDRAEALRGAAVEQDVGVLRREGVREFVRAYPEQLGVEIRGVHALSHPPGRVVLSSVLSGGARRDPLTAALLMAALASAIVAPTWLLARRFHGHAAAGPAVMLLAVSPAPVMFALASPEAIEATLFLTAAALLAFGGAWSAGRLRFAVAGGAVLGFATFFTFAAGVVAGVLAVLTLLARPPREAARVLAAAAAGGLAALIALRIGLGFDLIATYRRSHEILAALPPCPASPIPGGSLCHLARPTLYWLFGAPAGWLTLAGVPIAALAIRELVARRPRYLLALLAPVAVLYLLPYRSSGLIPGELERTVLYGYPFAAIAAGAGLARVTAEKRRAALVSALVLAAALQSILIEALYRTGW